MGSGIPSVIVLALIETLGVLFVGGAVAWLARSPRRLLRWAGGAALVYGAAGVGFAASGFVMRNLLARIGVGAALSVVAAVGLRRWRAKRANKRDPADASRALRAVTFLAISAAALCAGAVGLNVAVSLVPAWERPLRVNTVLASLLLFAPEGRGVGGDTAEPSARGALRQAIADGRETLVDLTGVRAVTRAASTLRAIVDLDVVDQKWLVESTPSMRALVDHPTLRALAADEEFAGDIGRASHGSLVALYRIAGREDVQSLTDDAALRRALGAIDLDAVHERIRTRLARRHREVRVVWEATEVRHPLEMNARLATGGGPWQQLGDSIDGLALPGGNFVVLRGRVEAEVAAERDLWLRVRARCPVTAWRRGDVLDLQVNDDLHSAVLSAQVSQDAAWGWVVDRDASAVADGDAGDEGGEGGEDEEPGDEESGDADRTVRGPIVLLFDLRRREADLLGEVSVTDEPRD